MLLFISKSELDEAKKRFPDFSEKFIYVPFCVDTKFWSSESSKVKTKNILFVGNDSNRDFNFLLDLAKEMKDFNFSNFIFCNPTRSNTRYSSILKSYSCMSNIYRIS